MRNKLFEKWIAKHFDGLSPFTLYQFCLSTSDYFEADTLYRAKADDFVYRTLYNLFLQGKNPWELQYSPVSFASLVFDKLVKCPYISTPYGC